MLNKRRARIQEAVDDWAHVGRSGKGPDIRAKLPPMVTARKTPATTSTCLGDKTDANHRLTRNLPLMEPLVEDLLSARDYASPAGEAQSICRIRCSCDMAPILDRSST